MNKVKLVCSLHTTGLLDSCAIGTHFQKYLFLGHLRKFCKDKSWNGGKDNMFTSMESQSVETNENSMLELSPLSENVSDNSEILVNRSTYRG
jgi:hypothetical protein